jgi:hypothetical protein
MNKAAARKDQRRAAGSGLLEGEADMDIFPLERDWVAGTKQEPAKGGVAACRTGSAQLDILGDCI